MSNASNKDNLEQLEAALQEAYTKRADARRVLSDASAKLRALQEDSESWNQRVGNLECRLRICRESQPSNGLGLNAFIAFDGGCRGNPGAMYGSYELRVNGSPLFREERFELGEGTNNVAEFLSLHRALVELIARLKSASGHPRDYSLMVHTDSMIVRNRVMGKNKIHKKAAWAGRSRVMFEMAEKCLAELRQFKSFEVQWHGREKNVANFGH